MPNHSEQHQGCASLKQFYFAVYLIQGSRKDLHLHFLFSALYSVNRYHDPLSGSLLSITLMSEGILCLVFILRKSPLLLFWALVLPAFNYLVWHLSSLDCDKYTRCWESNLQVFLTLFNKGLRMAFLLRLLICTWLRRNWSGFWEILTTKARDLRGNLATLPLTLVGSPSRELSSVKQGQ